MNQALLKEFIEGFAGLRVVVVGEAMLDSYLEGQSERLCREAPVPIVRVEERQDVPGGAANTAVNIHSLGGQATFLSVIGDDFEGTLLKRALEARGVATGELIVEKGRQTLAKHRVLAASQLLVRYDQGQEDAISPASEQKLIERLKKLFQQCDALVISDYGYGIFTPAVIEVLARLQAVQPKVIVADSKWLPAFQKVGVTAVKPNYGEAIKILGEQHFKGQADRVTVMQQLGPKMLELTGARIAAITMDTEGAMIFEARQPAYRTYTRPTSNTKATGAGDTYVSALTLALAAGANAQAAAELASAAAMVVVAKDGTSDCTAAELREFFLEGHKFLPNRTELLTRVEGYRQQGRKIVFTNGCFDILHRGHIALLNQAKALGDVLIVGLNSDESVRRLKGTQRPINRLADRVQVLEALSCVDLIVDFDENDAPDDLIDAIRPDIFVKGSNYTRQQLPEVTLVEKLGGQVRFLPYQPDSSTSQIIERIRENYVEIKPETLIGESYDNYQF